MNTLNSTNISKIQQLSPEVIAAWDTLKNIADLSNWLWDTYTNEFLLIIASLPPPTLNAHDNVPF